MNYKEWIINNMVKQEFSFRFVPSIPRVKGEYTGTIIGIDTAVKVQKVCPVSWIKIWIPRNRRK